MGGSTSKISTLTCDVTKADTYYVYSTSGGIKITEITVAYPNGDGVLIGDVDLDNDIDNADAALLLRYISGFSALNDKQLTAGDCNMDGNYTLNDVIAILNYA